MIVAVAYDVPETPVRERLARLLAGRGVRVQRSVFECVVEAAHYERFCRELRAALGRHAGEIRIYRLCGECHRASRRIGRGVNVSAVLFAPLIV